MLSWTLRGGRESSAEPLGCGIWVGLVEAGYRTLCLDVNQQFIESPGESHRCQ